VLTKGRSIDRFTQRYYHNFSISKKQIFHYYFNCTAIIQTFIWVIAFYLFIRYFQTNIYIERHYSYIMQLEQDISKELQSNIFNRERKNYLQSYPLILDIIEKRKDNIY
jgi:hypothetical protein